MKEFVNIIVATHTAKTDVVYSSLWECSSSHDGFPFSVRQYGVVVSPIKQSVSQFVK
jgi:hypothetical protein